ncbi:Ubiquitin-like domain-containing protein [Aphelenchoides besseyi]|nr:Ubiquitin-like domain-containing protein [Aphelenchoides besseyi]
MFVSKVDDQMKVVGLSLSKRIICWCLFDKKTRPIDPNDPLSPSKSIIYIGSELLPKLLSFNSLDLQRIDASVLSRCVVQIQFLAVYLSLGDMSAFNFGSNNHSNPIIVDFMMSDYVDPKPKFLNDANTFAASAGECNAMVDKISSADRLNIAKTSIEEWQRVSKLEEALKLMDKEESDFGRNHLEFEKKTADLKEFVRKVTSNVEALLNS